MRKLVLLLALFSVQAFAYEQLMSCSGKNVSLDVWSFTGSKNVEVRINDQTYDGKRADLELEKILLVHDESNHPFVYDTFLEKTDGSWKINKYWLCLGYYFEERGCVFDEYRLQSSVKLECSVTENEK